MTMSNLAYETPVDGGDSSQSDIAAMQALRPVPRISIQAFCETEGVAHPVLPCGVRLYIRFHGREVLTQVVDRGPNVPGREFDITKALANRLDLHGTQTIQWRFAR